MRARPDGSGAPQANGVQAYTVTLALFFAGWRLGAFSPARVYELFGEILSALNLFSLAFCGFLYAKARPRRAFRARPRAHPGQPRLCLPPARAGATCRPCSAFSGARHHVQLYSCSAAVQGVRPGSMPGGGRAGPPCAAPEQSPHPRQRAGTQH